MEELKKQHLEMLQLLESIEVMLQNGNSIHPNSVIRGAIQTAIGMEVDVTNVNDKCDNKHTAVEWLVEQYIEKLTITPSMVEQAKAMEKEQIIEAFFEGKNDGILMERYSDYEHMTPDEYYNETFKSE